MLTLVPWRGCAIVGTGQSGTLVQPADATVSSAEVAALVADANLAFPALHLTPEHVTLVHRGVVPAVTGRNGSPELKPAPEILDHAAEGIDGAVTVVGVKYTTARGVAEQVTRVVASRLGKRVRPSRTGTTTLPGAGIADHEALAIEACRALSLDVPLPVIRHLIALYAEAAPAIIRLMQARPDLSAPVARGVQTSGAEILYVIRNEMAIRLADIMVRRTGLGSAGKPSEEAIANSARIAAAELGWDQARIGAEVGEIDRLYDLG